MSEKTGFFYYINNLKLTPYFQDENMPDSPFTKNVSDLRGDIYDYIEKFHPIKPNQYYDAQTYEIDVDLYKWILMNYEDAIRHIRDFSKMLGMLDQITPDMQEWEA